MRLKHLGLALTGLALVLPATASARPKAAAGGPVQGAGRDQHQDALSAAGVAAITAAAGGDYTVTAPAPADVGAQFTPADLDKYRAVVFLNTGMASPLRTRSARTSRRTSRRAAASSASARPSRPTRLDVPDRRPRHALLGPHRRRSPARSRSSTASMTRARACPSTGTGRTNLYNFTTNVRGVSHVLAPSSRIRSGRSRRATRSTASRAARWAPTTRSPSARTTRAAARSTPRSATRRRASTPSLHTHLKGAISWAAGQSDPAYSDCGATVLKNYQQIKVSAPPNLNEPIGFDQLPGRPDHPDLAPRRRAPAQPGDGHDARRSPTSPTRACRRRCAIYTNSEDGLYGPAVDNNFAHEQVGVPVLLAADGHEREAVRRLEVVTQTTPNTSPPELGGVAAAWDPYIGYFQLSRFKFVEDAHGRPLDLTSEQQILRVPNNRQECCHVAGDIDFDKHNNLWLVTGDDTPAGGINAGGYGPFNDQLTDEQQTVRVTNATGGTFTLTFNGQTTAPLAVQRDRRAGRRGARGAVEHRRRQHPDQRRPGEHGERQRVLPARPAAGRPEPDHRRRAPALTGTAPTVGHDARRRRAAGTSGRPATTAARR